MFPVRGRFHFYDKKIYEIFISFKIIFGLYTSLCRIKGLKINTKIKERGTTGTNDILIFDN